MPNQDLASCIFIMDSLSLKQSASSKEVKICADTCYVKINTYLPYIVGPPEEVMLINEALGAEVHEDDDSISGLPDCDLTELLNLVLKISAYDYELTSEQYIQKVKKNDKTICISPLHAVRTNIPKGLTLEAPLSTTFILQFRWIGFADKK